MMGHEFHFRDKVPVAVLGATGSVGQRFIELLANHPWFSIRAIAASEKSVGKRYVNAVNWLSSTPIPKHVAQMVVQPCLPNVDCPLIFSAMDSSVAGEIEADFAREGYMVVTNARNHRMEADVPLLVPEINPEHLQVLNQAGRYKGKIVANPNCSTIGLVLALKPLDRFGIEQVHVVTMQAVSGAGYPGVASLDMIDNLIPYISGEEEKMESESLKILGLYDGNQFISHPLKISAQCNRVPVSDGHTECVSIKFKQKPTRDEIIEAWRSFTSEAQALQLPSAPIQPLHYFEEKNCPQPKMHRNLDKGMAVSIGRLRPCPLFDFKFTLLSHNTIRGAAGGAILNGEILLKKGFIRW